MPASVLQSVDLGQWLDVLKGDPRIKSLVIFGSLARREATNTSDVDLLVVHEDAVPEDVIDIVPDHVSFGFYTPARLAALPFRSPLFAVHLAREGVPVLDEDDVFRTVTAPVGPMSRSDILGQLHRTELRFDELLHQPRGLMLRPQSAGAELYALAKQGAMLLGASDGRYEFNRHRALERAFMRTGIDAHDRALIAGLEDVWLEARSRREFTPDAHELTEASRSVQRLLRALMP